jgi:hypothetical protein
MAAIPETSHDPPVLDKDTLAPGDGDVAPVGDMEASARDAIPQADKPVKLELAAIQSPTAPKGSVKVKTGLFMPQEPQEKDGWASRQQVMEYLSIERWSMEFWFRCPFALLFWTVFFVMAVNHAHVGVSFEVRDALKKHFQNLTAETLSGTPPPHIQGEDSADNVTCNCVCVPWSEIPFMNTSDDYLGRMCDANLYGLPLFTFFRGEVVPSALAPMKAFDARLRQEREGTVDHTQMHLGDIKDMKGLWFWLQHGFVPSVWSHPTDTTPLNVSMMFAPLSSLASQGSIFEGTPKKPG